MIGRRRTRWQAQVGIVYVTHRPEPRFGWFADSLARQIHSEGPEVLVVDGLHTPERAASFARAAEGRFALTCVPSKPSPYNGSSRRTPVDLFAAASARNTGIVYVRRPYLVFVDDCTVLGEEWLPAVEEAASRGVVVAGAYQKHREMVVEDGRLVSSSASPAGLDTRWSMGRRRPVRIDGGRLYGASFGAPRELLVGVNGLDELCDPCGGEDYQLGLRLQWSGARIVYDRRMLTIESDDPAAHGGSPVRVGRGLEPEMYMATLAEFGVSKRSTDGSYDNGHMVLDILLGQRATRSIGNRFDLRDLEVADLATLPLAFPECYWFDGTPLADLR